MNYRRKNQRKTPLLVKEIILPDKKEPQIPESYLKEKPVTVSDNLKNGLGIPKEKTINSFVIIGNHEVRAVEELLILEKKPLENYFGGTLRKNKVKRKSRRQKETNSLRELNCEELQTDSNGKETQIGSNQFFKEEESAAKDENIERKKLQLKIKKFENMQEIMNQKNYIKQRLEEEKFMQQQENLAETWWEIMKRRNKLKKLNLDDPLTYQKPFYGNNSRNYGNFNISLISRKFWNDDEDKSSKKPEERKREKQKEKKRKPSLGQSELDQLEKTFVDDLVFIDDEDTSD